MAEIGVNHEGSLRSAKDLVRLAAESGADAVKFQTYRSECYISCVQPERLKRAKRFELSYEDFRKLAKISEKYGIIFFSTPLSERDVDFLDEIAPLFKVSSGDLTNLGLIRHIATKNKPIIISTGLGTCAEIKRAVETVLKIRPDIKNKGELMLMHCIAAYPAPYNEVNLANIGFLRSRFGVLVGYSDHTLGIKTCEYAVCAGAVAVEKHFTLHKKKGGFHDHRISANPDEMRRLVMRVRRVERFMGHRERMRTFSENKMLLHLRRSVGTTVDIPAGVPLRKEWLVCLRPAWGINPEQADSLVGRCLRRPLLKGEIIKEEDLQ